MTERLYTVGHGSRPMAELLALLQQARIETLIDVRAQPRSRRHPQYNDDALRRACAAAGIAYHWAGQVLGGLRTARVDSPHTALDPGRRGFAEHMGTEVFHRGIVRLRRLAAGAPSAILCAERDPDRCHRSLIADYLVLQDVEVWHLIVPGQSAEHRLSPKARRESATLIYDRHVSGRLPLG